jgi:uncharacterized membrane protein
VSTYQKVLLVVHIGGAIIGIGPTFAFGVLGKMSGEIGPGGVHLLEGMLKVSKVLVTPVALVTQPLSGALLIFESGYDRVFWSQEWLIIAIVLYAGILFVSYVIDNPIIVKVIAMMKAGQAGTPEFEGLVKRTSINGALMGTAATVIIFLMIWKPGL